MKRFSLDEQIEALRDVAGPEDALQAALRTLRLFKRFEPEARAFFEKCIELEKAKQHPGVQAVVAAFPDATVG
jgi:hypothetical protein